MLKFDLSFIQSSRKENATKGSPIKQMQQWHGTKNSEEFCGYAVDLISHRCAGMSSSTTPPSFGPKQRPSCNADMCAAP